MRVLLVHNHYQQPGGEDAVFRSERALLERAGHEVFVYERDNDEIKRYSSLQRLDLVRRTLWASDSATEVRSILASQQIEIAHFYNAFPLVSPAAYYACDAAGVPVVQTVQNYRLICPGALLQRDGRPCEDCVGRAIPWPGVRHGCYRDSRAQSAIVAGMLVFHRMAGTWQEKVDTYVAATEFSRQKFIQGGLPRNRIVVKPNLLFPDPGPRSAEEGYVLFVGRLSREKGIATLLRAWETLPGLPLKVAGDGPMTDSVKQASARLGRSRIESLGWRSHEDVLKLMKGARFLVVPSEWYEGFPVTLVESLACGVPVVGSRLGGVGEVVRHGRSGLLFQPGDSVELARAVTLLWNDAALRQRLSDGARSQFEALYTADRNYELLMEIYEKALARRS